MNRVRLSRYGRGTFPQKTIHSQYLFAKHMEHQKMFKPRNYSLNISKLLLGLMVFIGSTSLPVYSQDSSIDIVNGSTLTFEIEKNETVTETFQVTEGSSNVAIRSNKFYGYSRMSVINLETNEQICNSLSECIFAGENILTPGEYAIELYAISDTHLELRVNIFFFEEIALGDPILKEQDGHIGDRYYFKFNIPKNRIGHNNFVIEEVNSQNNFSIRLYSDTDRFSGADMTIYNSRYVSCNNNNSPTSPCKLGMLRPGNYTLVLEATNYHDEVSLTATSEKMNYFMSLPPGESFDVRGFSNDELYFSISTPEHEPVRLDTRYVATSVYAFVYDEDPRGNSEPICGGLSEYALSPIYCTKNELLPGKRYYVKMFPEEGNDLRNLPFDFIAYGFGLKYDEIERRVDKYGTFFKSFHTADSGPWKYNRTDFATPNSENKKAGTASMESVGKHTDRFSINLTDPVNANQSRFLKFWYYIDDVTKINRGKDAQIEISSSHSFDNEELNWNLHKLDLHNGWNLIILDLLEGKNRSRTNIDIDLENLTRFRIYHFNSDSVTTRIDDIELFGYYPHYFVR